MATPGHGKATVTFFDGFRLSLVVSKGSQEIAVPQAEYTTLEDPALQFLQGVPGIKSQWSGFLDIEDDGWDETAFASLSNGIHYLTTCPVGIAAGAIAYLSAQQNLAQPRPFDRQQVAMLDWNGQGTGAFSRGAVLTTATAVTGTGPQAGRNVGVTTSTQTLIAHVLLLAASGAGSVTTAIQESSDNGAGDAYGTISGMSGALTAVGQAARLTFTGATETWKRTNVTALSGFTSATLLVALGIAQQ